MAIVLSSVNDFFMAKAALSISLNALDEPDMLSASTYANAKVTAFRRDIIDYDAANNYRSWTLYAFPTYFDDHVARYCHIAIIKNGDAATVVYPPTRLDIYGRPVTDDGTSFLEWDETNEVWVTTDTEPAPDDSNFYIFLGKITSSGNDGNTPREWDSAYPFITGNLDTDQYRNEAQGDWTRMFQYNAIANEITQLLTITVSRIKTLILGSAQKPITDLQRSTDTEPADPNPNADTTIPTLGYMAAYGSRKYLSRVNDDTAAGHLTFGQGFTSENDGVVDTNLTVGGFTGSKSFATGLLGNGWRITTGGHGEMDSLSLRKFLEVPELRFNRITVRTGVQWQTHGAGLIEEVTQLTSTTGIIKLKLEEGEYGAVAVDDLCMGIYHNETNLASNASQNVDSHNGNFQFAGFMTIYFRITAICDATGSTANPDSRNQYFIYELRPVSTGDKGWAYQYHPQPSMSFACYANPNNSERQSCKYSTTEYEILLVGMVDWTYDGNNISYIFGNLNGFTIPARRLVNGVWEDYDKILSGFGVGFGKAYMWGSIEQFDRDAYLVSQQLYQVALAFAPSVVLNNATWRTDYMWSSQPQQPSPDAPYLYSYWLQTYSDGNTTTQGPVISGYDNSLFNLQLNKEVVSAALSNWYEAGQPTDVLTFDVEAVLRLGNNPTDITSATATSDITGFSYTVDIDGSTATYHVSISGYVSQQVAGLLAESAFITFRCYGNSVNYAERTLSIIENRQGNDGQDGASLTTVNNYYAWTDSGTLAPEQWGAVPNIIPSRPDGCNYLWNYEQHLNADGTVVSTSSPHCIGYFSEDGVGIADIKEFFVLGTAAMPDAPVLAPDRKSYSLGSVDWSETPSEPTPLRQYLWNVEIIEFSDETFKVGPVHIAGMRGLDALTGDLSNEMDSIALDYEGKTSRVEQRSTTLSIYFGRTIQPLTSLSAISDNPAVVPSVVQSEGAYTGEVIVTVQSGVTLSTGASITIAGTCAIGSVTRVFTIGIVKAGRVGENAVLYQLVPSVNAIKVNGSGTYSDASFLVGVNKVDGANTSSFPILSTDTDPVAYLYYKIDSGSWTRCYTNTSIPANTAQTSIKLRLIAEASTSDSYSGTIFDMETVPVVKDGSNGTSISIKGRVASSSALPDPSGYDDGDAFITIDTGHLWVLTDGAWVDCGPFKGEDGTSQYFHQKWSDDGGSTFTARTDPNDPSTIGETEGTYMGFYVDSNPVDSTTTSDYSWHKIEAKDGNGQEMVFFRQPDWAQEGGSTATPDLVDISVSDPDTFQQDEYCPHTSGNVQWTDDPSGVTSTYKYEFYAIRKRISGVWQAFSAVKLWSRYAEDGDTTVFYQIILSTEYISVADDGNGGQTYSQSTVNVKLVQSSGSQNVNVPTSASLSLAYTKDGGTAHSLAITNASTGASISVTDVTSYITFMLSNGSNVIATKSCNIVSEASQGVPGVGIASIVEYYARSKSASSVPGNTATSNTEAWSTTMSQVSAEWPFLWNYEVSVGTDNQTKGQTDPAIIARYTEDGRGITAIKEYYILSASSTTPPNRWSSDTPTQWLKTDTAKTESSITSQGWSATAPRTTNALPYLWNFAAITYSKSYLYEYEPPQCVGVHGDSPLIADLDNEMDCLPVSSAGVLASAKTFTTVARLFYGSTEQTIAAIASGGISFTSSDNKVSGSAVLASNGKSATCTITAAAGTYSGNVEVAIRVTDTDGNTASKIFTIGLAKAGGDGEDGDDAIIYQLLPSVNAIKIDNSGTYSPEALTVAVNKVVGGTVTSQTVASGTSGLYLYYCIDDYKVNGVVTWTRFYTSKTFDLDDTELPTKNIRLRLVGSSLGATCTDAAITAASVITYDMETIPVVKDGTDATGLKADLDNEMTCFAVDENGEYVQGDDDSAVTNFSLYYGTEAQVLTNCRVVNLDARLSSSVSYTANSSRSAAITISPIESESFDGPIAVTIEGTCALGTVSKVFTVTFVKGGVNAEIFQLLPSVGAVKVKDDGTYIDPLYISVKRTVGKSSTFATSGFYCYYSVTAADGTNGSWQRWSSFGDGVANMLANIDSSSLRIRLRIQNRIDTAEYGALDAATLIYDRETIPFVKNGDAGDDAINYVLEASTSTFSHTNTVPFDVHAYRLSQEKELYSMYIVRVDLGVDDAFIWGNRYQVHSFIDVTPRGNTTRSIKFFAFFDSTDAMNYLRYLGGSIEYSQITADPVCSLAVNLAEPVISFQLSHEGTLTYPVDASTRRPNEISFTINAHFFINNVDVPLTAISCTPLSASSGISLATCELDGSDRGYCDFESVDSVAAPTSPQIYTVTASAVYGGVTYTMHKDISFSAVTAGTSVQGRQGLQGCVIRLRGEWDESIDYVNQSDLDETNQTVIAQGKIRYIDVVQYAVNGTTKWYQRNTNRDNYAAGIRPNNQNYWTESSAIEFIATKLILANNAHIEFGQGNQLLILDGNGNIVGGLSGLPSNGDSVTDDYRLWLGAADPADAPFSVTHDGSLVAANINSQFQDVSGYYTDDTDQGFDSGVGVELKYVKTALHFFTGSGTPVSNVKPRVYNLKANGTTITLPVAKEFVGLRVLLLNDNTNLHTAGTTPDVRTHVVQENNIAFLGAYCTKLRYDGLDFNNVQQYVLDNTVDIKDISFQSGIMEFLATPVFSGGVVVSCRWSLVNGSACAKWFDDYFLYQQNYGIILN